MKTVLGADVRTNLAPAGVDVVFSFGFTMKHVRADKPTVVEEVKQAGFEFVGEIKMPILKENYLLRFKRPSRIDIDD